MTDRERDQEIRDNREEIEILRRHMSRLPSRMMTGGGGGGRSNHHVATLKSGLPNNPVAQDGDTGYATTIDRTYTLIADAWLCISHWEN